MNNLQIESLENLLTTLYPEWKENPDFKDTPKRVGKMLQEFFRNDDPIATLNETSAATSDQQITIQNINCIGFCPHHLLPIEYNISISYVPSDKVLGLSRFSRLAKAVTSFPKLQENVTDELVDLIVKYLSPKWLQVKITGQHGCIKFRGVCENTPVETFRTVGKLNN